MGGWVFLLLLSLSRPIAGATTMGLQQLKDWETAWAGHARFAIWLVKKMKPSVVVDLGVGQGYSTFVFGLAGADEIYGIDWFDDMYVLHELRERRETMGLQSIKFLQGDFSSFAKIWSLPIDILHIDGTHDYNAVWRDFNEWNGFVKDSGVILMHDTVSYLDHVGRFFDEIEEYHRRNFEHEMGLGVVTKDKKLFDAIQKFDPLTFEERAEECGVIFD